MRWLLLACVLVGCKPADPITYGPESSRSFRLVRVISPYKRVSVELEEVETGKRWTPYLAKRCGTQHLVLDQVYTLRVRPWTQGANTGEALMGLTSIFCR